MGTKGNKVVLTLAIIGFVILVIGLLFAFVFFNLIINALIYQNVRLVEGTEQYERFEELPLDVLYKVYMFNVTNPADVSAGGKPIVREVGPYIYRQSRHKENITYNEDEDTMSYVEYMRFTFDEELSGSLRQTDTIIMANVVQNVFFHMLHNLLSMYLPDFIMLLATTDDWNMWEEMFADTETMFHSVQVGDILFNGYKFCEPDNLGLESKILCGAVKLLDLEVLTTEEDESLSFALFKKKQNQHDGWFIINAGNDDVTKLGLISSWNGRAQLDTWNGLMSSCNRVHGRDSVLYPPNIKEEDPLYIFATDICRAAEIIYVDDVEVKEIPGQKRTLRDDIFSTTDENECFCMQSTFDLYGEQKCLPDGFFDLQACLGAPLVASFPHFLAADEAYSNTVEGLSANSDDHLTYVVLEPMTGSPLQGYKRLQFNTFLRDITYLKRTKGLANSVLPLLWVEEGVEISDDLVDQMNDQFITPLRIVEIVKWIIVGIGAGMFVIFGILYYV